MGGHADEIREAGMPRNLLDNRMRSIAYAAKKRDWLIIDMVLDDARACGSDSVLGQEPRLTPLESPEPVTIHDMTPDQRAAVVIVNEGSKQAPFYRYRPLRAA
jgi:hypothetical protein